jgi:hypothetical protein
MEQFYFHWQLNGELIEDRTGQQFSSEEAACSHAVRQAASFIGGNKRPADTHLGIEVAECIRNFNWSRTALGPFEAWSPALRNTVGLMMANRFPMLLWWGPDYISLYNDAYVPILGLKHPRALGLPVRECWSEIWDVLKPLIDPPFNGRPLDMD